MTMNYGRLTPGQGVFPLLPALNDPIKAPPKPPAAERPPTGGGTPTPMPQLPTAPVAQSPLPNLSKLPQANPKQTYGFQYDQQAGWNNDFMTVYNQIKAGQLPKDAMRFTNPRTQYEADLYDFILYGTPMPYAEGGEILAGAPEESPMGGGLEQVIEEPAKIVGIKSGKVYATISEFEPEIIKVIPLQEAQGGDMMGGGAPMGEMPMGGGMPPMSPQGAPSPAMPGMEVPGYATGGELLAMGYDPNDPAVQAAIRGGQLNYSTPVTQVAQAIPQAQLQPYNPINSQPLYQESRIHSIPQSPVVPIAKAAEQQFMATQPQAASDMNAQGQGFPSGLQPIPNAIPGQAQMQPIPNATPGQGSMANMQPLNQPFQGGGPTQAPVQSQSLQQSFNNLINNAPTMSPQDSQDFNILYQSLQNQVAQGQATEAEAIQAFQSILEASPYAGLHQEAGQTIMGNTALWNSVYGSGAPTATPPPIATATGTNALAQTSSVTSNPRLGSEGMNIGGATPPIGPVAPLQPMPVPDVVHGGTAIMQPQVVSAIQQYFPPNEWTTAYYIAAAESKGNPEAVGAAGEVGLFQIHPVNWAGLTRQLGTPINAQTLKDPNINAMAAAAIWQGAQGWGRISGNPWATAPGVFRFFGGQSFP